MTATLAMGAGLLLLSAGFLAWAGREVARRPGGPRERPVLRRFALWWFSAAAVMGLLGLRGLLALAGVLDPAPHVALQLLQVVPLSLALWALLSYLAFLLTGRAGIHRPIAVLYLAYAGYVLWHTWSQGPWTVEVGPWSARLVPTTPPGPVAQAVYGVALAAPLLLATGAYVWSAARLREPWPRYRALMVGAGLVQVFGVLLVSFVLRWTSAAWFPLVYGGAVLLLGLSAVLAYRPPRALRARWGPEPAPAGLPGPGR